MSVYRKSLDACIGCGNCSRVCPMDVMYIDAEKGKSVIAFVEQCITCGQCWLRCPTDSIGLQLERVAMSTTAVR